MTLIEPVLLRSLLGVWAWRYAVDSVAECDSTNSELMRRAEAGAPSGSVLVADRQTAGRGRRGRNWLSAPESSLTFSVLWRFDGPVERLSGLSLAVGIALARGLERLGAVGIGLKWPNDVVLCSGGAFGKLAGILVELVNDKRGAQAVIGIGLNLLPPRELLPQPAAGLTEALSVLPDRHFVLAAILEALAEVLEAFAVDGFKGSKIEWQRRHAWQDMTVQLLSGADEPPLAGRCLGADDDGALLLQTDAGIRRIYAGDVSLRPA